MENNQIKIRINLEDREFEVIGDAIYVEQNFGDYIKEYLSIIKDASSKKNNQMSSQPQKSNQQTNTTAKQDNETPDSFGEYLNRFSKSISNVDKLLIASFYIQSNNDSKSFTISEAANLLVEQGIKLSNPNAFNKSNDSTKKVFRLTGNKFRVSETGVEHLKSL